jgi:hypothetical protein
MSTRSEVNSSTSFSPNLMMASQCCPISFGVEEVEPAVGRDVYMIFTSVAVVFGSTIFPINLHLYDQVHLKLYKQHGQEASSEEYRPGSAARSARSRSASHRSTISSPTLPATLIARRKYSAASDRSNPTNGALHRGANRRSRECARER